MILVTGATGTVGRELVRQLRARDCDFSILARDAHAARNLLGSDIPVRTGAFEDMLALRTALEGVDRLFLLCGAGPAMAELEINVVTAARAAKVQQIVKVSAPGASVDAGSELLRMHGRAEAAVESSEAAWTHLRPNGFMQNLWGPTQGLRRDGSFRLAAGLAPIPLIDAADIAGVAAQILTSDDHAGRAYELTGPEAPSYAGIAAILSDELGQPIVYHPLQDDEWRSLLLSDGLPPGFVDELVGYFRLVRDGHANAATDHVLRITGRQPKSLREFVRENRARLQSMIDSSQGDIDN